MDNQAGAELATSYLLDLGHLTVHHLVGPRTWLDAREREAGWRGTWRNEALACRHRCPAGTGRPAPDTNWVSGSRRSRGSPPCSAPTTTWRWACWWALEKNGRRVPEDISVVGFDDMPETEYFGPSLTTVHQDFDELGRRALRALIEIVRRLRRGPPAVRRDTPISSSSPVWSYGLRRLAPA
ncbi:substrate-binding domain-containing protein [Streptomyces sp. L7]